MISKSEREKDKAICNHVETQLPWRWWTSCSFRRLSSDVTGKDGDVAYACVQHDGHTDIAIRERDMAHVENAVNRLPAYIADAEEMDRRLDTLAEIARQHDAGERRLPGLEVLPPEVEAASNKAVAETLRLAVRIVRGEP